MPKSKNKARSQQNARTSLVSPPASNSRRTRATSSQEDTLLQSDSSDTDDGGPITTKGVTIRLQTQKSTTKPARFSYEQFSFSPEGYKRLVINRSSFDDLVAEIDGILGEKKLRLVDHNVGYSLFCRSEAQLPNPDTHVSNKVQPLYSDESWQSALQNIALNPDLDDEVEGSEYILDVLAIVQDAPVESDTSSAPVQSTGAPRRFGDHQMNIFVDLVGPVYTPTNDDGTQGPDKLTRHKEVIKTFMIEPVTSEGLARRVSYGELHSRIVAEARMCAEYTGDSTVHVDWTSKLYKTKRSGSDKMEPLLPGGIANSDLLWSFLRAKPQQKLVKEPNTTIRVGLGLVKVLPDAEYAAPTGDVQRQLSDEYRTGSHNFVSPAKARIGTNPNPRASRSAQNQLPAREREWLLVLYHDERSPLRHGFSENHLKDTATWLHFQTFGPQSKLKAWDFWECTDDPSTWPQVGDMPDFELEPRSLNVAGQPIEKGRYPPDENGNPPKILAKDIADFKSAKDKKPVSVGDGLQSLADAVGGTFFANRGAPAGPVQGGATVDTNVTVTIRRDEQVSASMIVEGTTTMKKVLSSMEDDDENHVLDLNEVEEAGLDAKTAVTIYSVVGTDATFTETQLLGMNAKSLAAIVEPNNAVCLQYSVQEVDTTRQKPKRKRFV